MTWTFCADTCVLMHRSLGEERIIVEVIRSRNGECGWTWIEEFRFHEGEWKKCEMERWRITERVESKVELYYLEMNRKKTGGNEDD